MYGILNNQNQLIAKFTVPLTVRSNKPTSVSDALSLKRFVTSSAAQRWEIESEVEPLSHNAGDLMVELVTKGKHDTVKILFPQNFSVKNKIVLNNPTVTAGGSAGSSTIAARFNGTLPKGLFVKFPNHNKIYMLTENASSNNTTNDVTLYIYPKLLVTQTAGTTLSTDVIANFYVDTESVSGMVYNDGILMEMGSLTFIEAL
jgi:hypothetical protein